MKQYFCLFTFIGGRTAVMKLSLASLSEDRRSGGSTIKSPRATYEAPVTTSVDADKFVTLQVNIPGYGEFIGFFDASGVGHFCGEPGAVTLYPAPL